MPSACDRKTGVVLLDTREHTPEHEHAVHLKLADGWQACSAARTYTPPIQQPPLTAIITCLPKP